MRFLWKSQIERGRKVSPKSEKKTRRPPTRGKYLSAPLLFVLWLLLFGTLGYTLLFSPFLLIDPDSLQVDGAERLSAAKIKGFVREDISGRWLDLFPKNNFLLFRPETLEEKLFLAFPLARSAEATRIFPHGLRIEVRERERIVLWCSGGPCYLVTESGMAAEARQSFTEENREFVRTIIDTSAQPVRVGQKLFLFDLPGFVAELEHLLEEELGLKMEVPYEAASRFAEELRFGTAEGFRVYVSTALTPLKTVAALRLLFEKELPEERRRELEYIDARTENRVYYLMKNSEDSASQPSPVEEKKEKKKKD